MAPRGDQIPVIELQTTAPPSRVNFREIRAPGVREEKPRTGKQKLDTEGAEKRGICAPMIENSVRMTRM